MGIPTNGVRRAAGLRREELARLADLSVDYIIRLEQGRATSPSPQVLSALARALRLSAAEREHLYLLAGLPPPGPEKVPTHIPPSVRRLLDRMDGAPLSVYDAMWNLVLWNPLWAALVGETSHGREGNLAWRHFTAAPGRRPSHGTEQRARFRAALVTDLRAATARYPADADLRSLIGDLRAASTDFADLWDAATVGVHEVHTRTFHHPAVGALTLDCDVFPVPGSDLHIVAYTAPPGSDTAARLKLLNLNLTPPGARSAAAGRPGSATRR